MLVATLNYNLPDLTDNLVNQIQHDHFANYELMVVDNGSTIDRIPQSTTHKVKKNKFYVGGLNYIFKYFLTTNHNFLTVFNNDLIFHGPRLLFNMRNEVLENDLALYSPSIINAEEEKSHWKQMWNWGTRSVRKVPFIDYQCPVLRRDLVEKINQFPDDLYLGWGADFYSGIIARENQLKIGVSDNITLCHLNSYTFKQRAIDMTAQEHSQQAGKNLNNYFNNSPYNTLYKVLQQEGASYNA